MDSLPGQLIRAFADLQGNEYELRSIRVPTPAVDSDEHEHSAIALYKRFNDGFHVLLASEESALEAAIPELSSGNVSLAALGRSMDTPVIDSRRPVPLMTVEIPKPWGQEIWYTGIETRGISSVKTLTTSCPLNWWLAAIPESLSGVLQHEAPILLKILAPHHEPVLGDLYFELHEIKREVYVISAIDETAWPGGTGAIRIGFSPQRRAEYQSDEDFKLAYAAAVASYRQVRCQVDDWLLENGLMAADPCKLESVKESLEQVPADLQMAEKQRRLAMEEFTQLHSIGVGDVVVIPRNVPHSLQHGVRAVEFQTPVYERKIVSFAQRVLTQAHWDTDAAMQVTDMRDYLPIQFDAEPCGQGSRQKIVDFDDFSVWRYTVPAQSKVLIDDVHSRYLLLMTLIGVVSFAKCLLQGEQAALLPAALLPGHVCNVSDENAIVLIAMPS
ncbi:MAG: hypothetical protein AB8B48_08540 [Pseudomonadales bacterium]